MADEIKQLDLFGEDVRRIDKKKKIKQNGNDSNFAVDGRGHRPAPVGIGGAEAGEEVRLPPG